MPPNDYHNQDNVYGTVVITKPLNVEQYQVARDSSTKPTDFSCESACSMLASTPSFYPRDAMLARVFATATCLSGRPSVRLSVTRRYCA